MSVNVGEMSAVLGFLEKNPEVHDQDKWYCGTTACVAGWTVALQRGYQPGEVFSERKMTPGGWGVAWVSTKSGQSLDINDGYPDSEATQILGLSDAERIALFHQTLNETVKMPRYLRKMSSEQRALALMRALINREKEELTQEDKDILLSYDLSLEPSWKTETAA